MCAGETCANDVYTGPSSCNASGQCIKPNATACFPYHCNANKCFTACTTNAQCITPNICGMNGMISSCGLKPLGAACSAANECSSKFCAQGVCCNNACNTACKACNLAGTVGSCSNIASGVDPQGQCPAQAASTCGTTGQCAAGACARHASGTVCLAAACPTASTRARPPVQRRRHLRDPGRRELRSRSLRQRRLREQLHHQPRECTAPAMCVAGSCGLLGNGGACTANSSAQPACLLPERGQPGRLLQQRLQRHLRILPSGGPGRNVLRHRRRPLIPIRPACVAATNPMTCGLNGRCAGNNTATNAAGTARCQFFGSTQGCRADLRAGNCHHGGRGDAGRVLQRRRRLPRGRDHHLR